MGRLAMIVRGRAVPYAEAVDRLLWVMDPRRGGAAARATACLLAAFANGGVGFAVDPLAVLPTPAPGAVRVFVVRHGEALSNLPHPHTPMARLDRLTARGHVEAGAAGKALEGRGIELVLTSPAGRARETAADIGRALGNVPLRVEARLEPLRMGVAPDGHHLSWAERKEDWAAGRDPSPPEGESLAQLGGRIGGLLEDAGEKARHGKGPRTIALVTHSEVVNALVGVIDQRVPLEATMSGVHNASITVVDLEADGRAHLVAQDLVPWR